MSKPPSAPEGLHPAGVAPSDPPLGLPRHASWTRGRRAIVTSGVALVARVASFAVGFATLPVALHYLGPTRYGVWATVTSGVGLLGAADLGLGNGLMNRLSRLRATGDKDAQRAEISNAFAMFVPLAALLIAVAMLLAATVPWGPFFGLPNGSVVNQVPATIAAVAGLSLIGVPLGMFERIQSGLQEGWNAQFWNIAGQLLLLGAVLAAASAQLGLWQFAALVAGCPLMAAMANGMRLLSAQHPELRPRLSDVTKDHAFGLLKSGSLFFFLQFASSLAFATDTLVIAKVLGPGEVTKYAVGYRLFTALAVLLVLPIAPLWPAYAEAMASEDHDWVRRIYRRSLLLMGGLGAAAGLGLALVGPLVASAWVGGDVRVPASLFWAFGAWLPVYCVGNAMALLLNAAGIIRFQLISVGCMVACNLILSVWLSHVAGVAGPVLGSLLSFGLLTGLPAAVYLARFTATLRRTA